jgi:hypothetical protein
MPTTFRTHFDEDIGRSDAIFQKAVQMTAAGEPRRLCVDLWSSAVALAVGALDAYFCDAYVDCLSAVLRAYAENRWGGRLPSDYAKQMLPAGEILNATRQHRTLWSVRMAARKVMEKDNMLSLARLEACFNGILPANQKLWPALIPQLLSHNRKRLTSFNAAEFAAIPNGGAKQKAEKRVVAAVKARIGRIIQFRHDWIHNCGRPKNAIVDLTYQRAKARIRDIRVFIHDFDGHLTTHRLV